MRPQRLLGWAAGVWLACAAAFWLASEEGLIAPAQHQVFSDPRYTTCRTPKPHWTACAALPLEHSRFEPLGYSLDRLLPMIDLQQERSWAPISASATGPLDAGDAMRWLGWFEAVFGWVALLMGLVCLGGWTDRDRRD